MAKFKLIDSHAHLTSDQYERDLDDVIRRAREQGVGVVLMGVDLSTSKRAVEMAGNYDGLFACVGFHPHEAKGFSDESLEELRALTRNDSAAGIGEIGLDHYRDLSPREVQREVFARQLSLACELQLPVSVHNREATGDMLELFQSVKCLPQGVIHSFSGSYELARQFIDLGFYLGISGPITFNGEDEFREAVSRVPLAKILVETDSPYLTPQPNRGKRNEPGYLKYVAETIAELKGLSYEEICRVTTENSRRLYEINGD